MRSHAKVFAVFAPVFACVPSVHSVRMQQYCNVLCSRARMRSTRGERTFAGPWAPPAFAVRLRHKDFCVDEFNTNELQIAYVYVKLPVLEHKQGSL
jgi:hypothetical protein